jgi:beta-glucosidase
MRQPLRAGLSLVLAAALPGASVGAQPPPRVVDSAAFLERHLAGAPLTDHSQRVKDLLAKMTLEEKVGQMTQLAIDMVTTGKGATIQVDPAKLRKAVVQYGAGSILNVNDEALPPAKWAEIVRAIQSAAAETRLKIPVVYGIDSIHGATYVKGATIFPQPLGMAATWNPDLMLEGSRITAAETRAAGIPWNFSPVLDVGRQPLWPRLYETFGEDSYLTTVMGIAAVRGYQGNDASDPARVAACLKHYAGYSLPTTGHDRTPALIPEVTMREHVLPPFAAAVKAGALSVMVNSGEVNGVPGHFNKWLLTDVLRGEMGFDGVAVSDWEDIKKAVTVHHAAPTEKEATRLAVLAGVDMSMVPNDYSFADLLLQLAKEGAVPPARIDEAVTRILTMKARLGLFDDPLRGIVADAKVGTPEARAAALTAARESLVLLKNASGVLPIPAGRKVLLTGPTADSLPSLANGWTWTWQGDRQEAYPKDRLTVRGALSAKLGAALTYVPGASFDKEIDVAAAVAAARAADVAVVALGEMSYAETPGNIDDLDLPEAQIRLAQAVLATGKPVVLLLVEGRPRIVRPVVEGAHGLLLALNPGLEGGQAITDVLMGDASPSGRLPITYPRHPHALRTYDHKAFEDLDQGFGLKAFQPQFEFGAGLSYTTFAYADLTVTGPGADGSTDVSVGVRNTGARAGTEVVQLYLSDHYASLTPPVKRLKRFAKVTLAPGEAQTVRFRLTRGDFSFIGADHKPVVEPGAFSVLVGGLKQDLTLER